MADDIDIEEHDVLDNPVIRSIFPDISIIKKEILLYEDVTNIKQEPDIENPPRNPIIQTNVDCKGKGHKDSTQILKSLKDIVDNHSTVHHLEQKPVQSNKIILGSKPNITQVKEIDNNLINKKHNESKKSVRIPKVVLQDLGAYIYRNNRYCLDCQILFPSRSDLSDHKRKVHSMNTKNKQLNAKVTLEKTSFGSNSNKCNICGTCFCNSSNLARHYRNVHRKKMTYKSNYKRKRIAAQVESVNKSTNSKSKNDEKKTCFHCKEQFSDNKSLIEHIYKVLECKRMSKNNQSEKTTSTKEKPKYSATSENNRTLKDQLTFEYHDSDADETQLLDTITNIENKPRVKRKLKQPVSTVDHLKPNQTSTENKDKNQGTDTSRTLRKRKSENQYLDKDGSTTERNGNEPLLHTTLLKKKQKHDINTLNSIHKNKHGGSRGSQEEKVKQKPKEIKSHSPSSHRVKINKVESKSRLLSTISENDTIEEELQPYKCDENNLKNKFVYECIYCTYILHTAKSYHRHVAKKHKVKKMSNANRVIFDEQCKFCPSKCNSYSAHNIHLYSYHYELVYRHFPNEIRDRNDIRNKLKNPAFKKFQSFVLESIIYKCNRCDIHFLSSCIAKDHEKHMELLINWKCSICRRIFKKHDKYLHLKQHSFSKTLNVCQFNESELSRLLYNCTKCAIHFTEERYLEHYSKCDEQTTDSVYCKTCDILIDKCGYEGHEIYHRLGKSTTDFTIMVADIITVPDSGEMEVAKKRKRLYEQVNCLTFCPTCKSYLTDLGLSRKTHTESRCSEIKKYTCNLCGLVLTNKAMGTHRQNHKKQKDLNLQHFKFFDLKGIQINPPIPEYPICKNCDVIFVSRNAVSTHICSETDHIICNVCNVKLSENAFKLHMNFHNYSILKSSKNAPEVRKVSESGELKKEPEIITNVSSDTATTSKSQMNIIEPGNCITNLSSNSTNQCKGKEDIVNHSTGVSSRRNILYTCQSCKITVDAYDRVIEHCQNHFSPSPIISLSLKICPKCSLKFDPDAFESHQELHLQSDTTQVLIFDPTYFTSDKNTWVKHLFASVPQSVQKEIVSASIYQHECRIKMEVVQKGPPYLTVYKCSKCGNFIDPDCLFVHIRDSCSKNVRKHPCAVCGLPFMANTFRARHEKIHKRYDNARLKSYNIVLFNCEAHNSYNNSILNAIKQYVLYQCRTCEGIVDKLQRNGHQCNVDDLSKCPTCKLLFYKDDFERHISKHTAIDTFNAANIKVILFGNNNYLNVEKKLSPSFGGTVYDYILYKCIKCEVCVNSEISIPKHVCVQDDSKWKCPKCGHYICARLSLKKHIKMHDVNLEFKTENIKVVPFGLPHSNDKETVADTKQKIYYDHKRNSSTDHNIDTEEVLLYKCVCGFHYMDETNARNHVKHCGPKIKVVKQTCSKCSLVFNPKELFSHILAHHRDKSNKYKYKIIEISPESENITNNEHKENEDIKSNRHTGNEEITNKQHKENQVVTNDLHMEMEEITNDEHIENEGITNNQHVDNENIVDKIHAEKQTENEVISNKMHAENNEIMNNENTVNKDTKNNEHVENQDITNKDLDLTPNIKTKKAKRINNM